MELGQLLKLFSEDPAGRLFKADNAPFVVDFLYHAFKESQRTSISHSDLSAALGAYQEEVQEIYPDRFVGKPDAYLLEWCSPGRRWLHRFLEAERDEPTYQLTSHVESVIGFVVAALSEGEGFVGTESRLKLIIHTLADLTVKASDDPERRLAFLRDELARVQAAIDRIEQEGNVETYRPAQIRERFGIALQLLRQLLGDFRGVEESFREIARQVQVRHNSEAESRGAILEFALDEEDALRRVDQGVSFYEFARLVLSPSETERVERIVNEVCAIPELAERTDGLDSLSGMLPALQREAEKVLKTNRKLSVALRRLVDVQTRVDRRRIASALREIQDLAVEGSATLPGAVEGLSLDVDLSLTCPFQRAFWSEPKRFDEADLADFHPEDIDRLAAFRDLAAMRRLDWRKMRERVAQMLATEDEFSLGQLVAEVGPLESAVEALGYVQIAVEDGHVVDRTGVEEIVVGSSTAGTSKFVMTMPKVTFRPSQEATRVRAST